MSILPVRSALKQPANMRTSRCLNIAYSHILLSSPLNALALLSRASTLASKAAWNKVSQSSSASTSKLKLDVPPSQASNLQTKLQNLVLQYQGLVELQKLTDNSALAAQKNLASAAPTVQRLNEYPLTGVDLKNLVTYPPKLEPVPVKPLFLDLAWNYIDYPGRELEKRPNGGVAEPQRTAESAQEKPKKKGWFGFGGT